MYTYMYICKYIPIDTITKTNPILYTFHILHINVTGNILIFHTPYSIIKFLKSLYLIRVWSCCSPTQCPLNAVLAITHSLKLHEFYESFITSITNKTAN